MLALVFSLERLWTGGDNSETCSATEAGDMLAEGLNWRNLAWMSSSVRFAGARRGDDKRSSALSTPTATSMAYEGPPSGPPRRFFRGGSLLSSS
jgi:hypothetical protein